MRHIIYYCFAILFFTACQSGGKKRSADAVGIEDSVLCAKGFSIKKFEGYTKVEVRDPWDTTKCLQRYILVGRDKELPDNLPEGTVVRVPLKNVAVFNSVHCSILERLDMSGEIKGVCEPRYMDNITFVKKGISEGSVIDLGESYAPNIERIINLSPEAIIMSPIQGVGYSSLGKLGIPVIQCTDYMENTPLGQTEWIRFHALFYEKEEKADSIFQQTIKSYNEIKELVHASNVEPTVFSEMKTGAVWYIAGGRSFIANLFADAGARYVWRDDLSAGSIPMSYEAVFEKAANAEFWLIKYNSTEPLSYENLKQDYAPNAFFSAYKERNIWGCNTSEKQYYEDLPLYPERLLKELVWIFHPELLPDYEPRYYEKIKE